MNWYKLFETLLDRLGARFGIPKDKLERVFRVIFWVYLALCSAYGFAIYSDAEASLVTKGFNTVLWVAGAAMLYWLLMLALALLFSTSKLLLRILLSGTGVAIIWYLIKRNFS